MWWCSAVAGAADTLTLPPAVYPVKIRVFFQT